MVKTPITLVSTFGEVCGIAEYAAYLKDAVEQADPGLTIEVETNLHPDALLTRKTLPPVVVLNYQAALLSQWHVGHLDIARSRGCRSLVVWHDSGVPNTDHCKAICTASDHFVLHEPYDDLPTHGTYLRQGVPDWQDPVYFDLTRQEAVRSGVWWGEQPVVGAVGLSIGYRNLDLLCESASVAGWGVLLITPKATDEDEARWKRLNPATVVIRQFVPRDQVVSYLAGCTATANLVVTNNAGTSGAIRQCVAARKPVLAFKSRQFRDLLLNTAGQCIRWIDGGVYEIAGTLATLPLAGLDAPTVAVAAHDSWRNRGKDFSRICRELLA